jgi:GxxExxY protein
MGGMSMMNRMGCMISTIDEPNLKYLELTGLIIGCAMKAHNQLGSGYRELIYQRALAIEFRKADVRFEREFEMPITYDGQNIGTRRVDFLVEGKLSVELKAVVELERVHLAQAINYLEAYNLEIGLLINFGNTRLEFHRLSNKKYKPVLP